MQCEDFRQHLLAEPNSSDMAILQHKTSCNDCAKFAEQIHKEEQELINAFAVDYPINLADKIMANIDSQNKNPRRNLQWLAYALAATIAGFTILTAVHYTNLQNLEKQFIAHIEHEASALTADDGVQLYKQNLLFAPYNLQANSNLIAASFAKQCNFKKIKSFHVVYRNGLDEAISVFVLPGTKTYMEIDFSYKDYKGKIMPIKTANSTVVIIGGAEQNIEGVWLHLQHNLKFASYI